MPLESLLELVRKLRERIDADGDALRQNEALTRYALIDPLLRELGWDTSDPGLVIPEYRVPNNQFADYVLLSNKRPKVVVESKKLDEPLQGGKALDQGILYCAHTGSTHFLLTDGQRWEIYESSKTTPEISFDLKGQPPEVVCLQALALWRPAVEVGHVAPAQSPVIDYKEPSTIRERSPAYAQPGHDRSGQETGQQPSAVPQLPSDEGQSLATVEPGDVRPTKLTFPYGRDVSIRAWKHVLTGVTKWLSDEKFLEDSHCPIPYSDRSRRYIVHTTPVHPDGKSFDVSGRELVGSLFVDTKHTAGQTIRVTRSIIRHVGQDPAQFKVRFD